MKNILWDFDGVILSSMHIRDWGFREIFKTFKKEDVQKLLDYHNLNGGLSRYVKIRYFYEEILKREITKEEVLKYASSFSLIMKKELVNPNNLIQDSLIFIQENYKKYNFHIVSGSDQKELKFLCETLGISKYFLSINGSPTPKNVLVNNLLEKESYNKIDTCLIGDSINDRDAANVNGIKFIGYNNLTLNKGLYIKTFLNNNILN
ncbi:HAD hydrolase-like protein [Flavobacteriaceae bacterium]|nr:HAD hydrolase-like protein [Flavobacteriaceae bacterium]